LKLHADEKVPSLRHYDESSAYSDYSGHYHLVVPSLKLSTIGIRTFLVVAAKIWKALPVVRGTVWRHRRQTVQSSDFPTVSYSPHTLNGLYFLPTYLYKATY